MTNVYVVTEDDVIYFPTIREARQWVKDKFNWTHVSLYGRELQYEDVSIYKCSEYDGDGDCYPIEMIKNPNL